MARHEHTPIYKAALDMRVHSKKLVAGFSRYHKYTLGNDLREGTQSFSARHGEGIGLRLVDTSGSSAFVSYMIVYRPNGSVVRSSLDEDVASAQVLCG
jgi:hypothetical protein